MQPGHCLATFHDEGDGFQHRCFLPYGHVERHRCICIFRGLPFSEYGPYYYGRDGKAIPMCEWAVRFEDLEYKRVAQTTIGPWWISTVWLGLDHGFLEGRPLIFESMIFWHGPEGGEPDHDRPMERYTTEAQARRGHASIVRTYRALVRSLPKFPEKTSS